MHPHLSPWAVGLLIARVKLVNKETLRLVFLVHTPNVSLWLYGFLMLKKARKGFLYFYDDDCDARRWTNYSQISVMLQKIKCEIPIEYTVQLRERVLTMHY
jgi:hypothetical protein